MLFNFCFDYWMILLFSMSIFLCSKWYSIYKPCHLKCDSQISLFTNDGLSESQGKHYWKKRKIRKKTVPSLASTWHGNPLHSCEIDKPIFIGMLGVILGLNEPLKTVLVENQGSSQMMRTTVEGTVSTTLPVLSTDWCVAILFNFNKNVRQF